MVGKAAVTVTPLHALPRCDAMQCRRGDIKIF
jgi:hypothetical protein